MEGHQDRKTDNGAYKATFETRNATVTAKRAVQPFQPILANVLEPVMPESKSIFRKVRSEIDRIIYHPPVAAVTVAYPKSSFKDIELDNGFGNLQDLPGFEVFPNGRRSYLGYPLDFLALPGRCPPDYNLLLNYIGGSRMSADLTEEEIVAEVDKGMSTGLAQAQSSGTKGLGVKCGPRDSQYEIGTSLAACQGVDSSRIEAPGLYISGNYRTGVAFPDLVRLHPPRLLGEYDGCPAVESKEEIRC
jgi:oxygen-dependent protoporphyrinogen oxidase